MGDSRHGQLYCAQLGNDAVVITGFTSEQAAQDLLDKLGVNISSPAAQIDQAEVTPLVCRLFRLVREHHGLADTDPARFASEVLHGTLIRHVPSGVPEKDARHALALAFMMNAIRLPNGLLKF